MTTIRAKFLLPLLIAIACPAAAARSQAPEGWAYRRIVTVENTGAALADHQVRIDLNAANFNFAHAQADGGDLRFTLGEEDRPVPFWIERWSQDSARVWVRLPWIPTERTALRLYYGNPAAQDAADGFATFDFFDDFDHTGWARGYFTLSAGQTVLAQTQPFQATAPHTFSVVRADRGGYAYWGYYGPSYWATANNPTGADPGWVALARSNDLVQWTQSSTPLFGGGGERWPSVLLVNGTFYMAHTRDYSAVPSIVLRTSTDGSTFGAPVTLVPQETGWRNQNPALFRDPADGTFYLYWFRGNGTTFEIRAKAAETVAGLAQAASFVVLVPRPTVLAAPQVMYHDGTYYLAVETAEPTTWYTRIYASDVPAGGFRELPGNPVLGDGQACFFQHVFANTLHAYYCRQSTADPLVWTVDYRTADLGAGRRAVLAPDAGRFAASGGTWSLATGQAQAGGSTGTVLQGVTTARQLLASSFTGRDYVLQATGRQMSGRVWGLGMRVADAGHMYSVNLYEDLDAGQNLFLYRWNGSNIVSLGSAAVGAVATGAWHRLGVTVRGTTLTVTLNGAQRIQVTDATFASGTVALYGEAGTTAQFDNVFVRKAASPEPSTWVGLERPARP